MSLDPKQLVGLKASFEHKGQRVVGIVTDAVEAPPWGKGQIPDLTVTVRGQSGRLLTVSMVETYMTFPDR